MLRRLADGDARHARVGAEVDAKRASRREGQSYVAARRAGRVRGHARVADTGAVPEQKLRRRRVLPLAEEQRVLGVVRRGIRVRVAVLDDEQPAQPVRVLRARVPVIPARANSGVS